MAAARKIRIAAHIEVDWLERRTAPARCPNCGAVGQAEQLLEIDYRPPDAVHRFVLQICPACTARFVDNTHTMDYGTDELIEIGWNIYQVQLGAGVWPISAPLTRVQKPAGARVLEIGGAYGFGLDFCIRARGWQGVGYDPSPLAAFGARELGLDIRQQYFTQAEVPDGPWDVAIATEVLEHLEHPPEFLALMRAALGAQGILVLTTPDGEGITPALEAGVLMPLLSPGAHLVLQTAASLEHALRAAGFAHVTVLREGLSLAAYASAAPFALSGNAAAGRAMYRRYLVERSRITAPESDLCFGFAGRGLFEAANDGDAAAVEAAWSVLLPAARARFGLDLASMRALPEGAADASLAGLARLMPLGLGMILFGRAMHLLSLDTDRAELLALLRLAGAAVEALQRALAKRSLTDGLSASIGRIIETEIWLCQAEAGDAASAAGLIARADVVDGWRGFVALVNAGALEAAGALKAALLADMPDAALPAALHRNALLSLANFVLAPGGETMRAFEYAQALRALGEDADAVVLQAFTRLVNASRYAEAQAAAARYGVDALASRAAGTKIGQDTRLAQMVLDLAAGDPAEVPARLAGLEIDPARRDILLLEAFIRLVNASRYDEALRFIAAHGVPALAARTGGEVARNAALARMVLDLAVGDPAEIPARLEGLEISPARRDVLLLEAFIRLANASRFAEAQAFAARHDVAALAARQGGAAGSNAAIALAVVDLAVGDPALVPGRFAGVDVAPGRQVALLLGAYTGLVNAARYDEAGALAAAAPCFAGLDSLPGAAADDARLASVMLDLHFARTQAALARIFRLEQQGGDPAVLGPLLVDGFVRLVNEGNFTEARAHGRAVERRLAACKPALRHDALAALLMLELRQGDGTRIVQRVEEALGGGLEEARLHELVLAAFVTLVNAGDFANAQLLLHLVEPLLLKLRPPHDEAARNALFAAGMLFLQQREDWRRAAAVFARLRDALVKLTPPGAAADPLFWPALRGEIVVLNHLQRGEEAMALLRAFTGVYPDAPDDLRQQLEGSRA
ncbi:class I SAM-dependent methyltransferase [Acidocella sp.]|uniref:class I SAM-dependent methyltransferase n=1 Tax=Acidocella sp. TaxID=50710 RepID=UPI0017C75574|nr:class I SAM-dependent methyltransferase [Acidocella sp.]NNM58068.1 class I SAM-dependent methyltransferase [Acidocella sp.]